MNDGRKWLSVLLLTLVGACGGEPPDADTTPPEETASAESELRACVQGSSRSCGISTGSCSLGKQTCLAGGAWGACKGAVMPAARDTCAPGNDDNCNGIANEGCGCVRGTTRRCGTSNLGSCSFGTQTCAASGAWGACTGAVMPAARDTCAPRNDDNCNGIANEGCGCVQGMTRSCGITNLGPCATGTQTCAASGAWGACNGAVWPQARDTCAPGNDDNCNGIANEGCACVNGSTQTCGPAACPGRQTCASGNWGSCQGGGC